MEAAKQISNERPDIKIIALSMHSDSLFVTEMLKSGASGYLLKDCAFEELSHAINSVISNQIYLSPRITGTVIKDYMGYLSMGDPSEASVLTAREREVLQLIAEGKKIKLAAKIIWSKMIQEDKYEMGVNISDTKSEDGKLFMDFYSQI